MRIHFFVRTLNVASGGGSHYNSVAYIRALRAHGHDVTVHVFSKGNNAFPQDIEPVVHEGWGLSFRKSRSYLAELLHEYESDADVFFLYAVEFAWGGGLYRRRGGRIPVCVYMDAYLPSMNMVHLATLKEKIYRWKRLPWDKTVGLIDAKHVDRFLPCSPYIGNEYVRFGFPKDRFTLLPNIVPDQSVSKVPNRDGATHIIYLGRLIYEKGIDLLIESLKELSAYKWRLTVVGDGPMRPYVEEQGAQAHLPIELVGWVPQKETASFYAKADVFVHPARWADPAPRAVVDALYAGLPAIVPDTGGSAWIAGEAGITFKTGDKASLTAALEPLLRDGGMRTQWLVSKAPEEVRKFSEGVVYPQLERILEETAGFPHS